MMYMKVDLSKKWANFLNGKTILGVIDLGETLEFKLDDGSNLKFEQDTHDLGADGGRYTVITAHLNDEKIWTS